MTQSATAITALYDRLLTLAPEASPEQLAYLAKSVEAVASQEGVDNIATLADSKLQELIDAANNHLATLQTAEELAVTGITDNGTTYLNNLETAKDDHITAITIAGDDKLAAITQVSEAVSDVPEGSTVMTEINKSLYLGDGSAPFLFGILSRNADHDWGVGDFSTHLGQWYQDSVNANHMLSLLTGCHDYSTDYIGFYEPPQLRFLQGSKGSFVYREMFTRDNIATDTYLYPYALIGNLFIKNTGTEDVTKIFQCGGSNHWESGYEGAAVFMAEPDSVNSTKESITTLNWTNLFSDTTNTHDMGLQSINVTIPAQKTIALLFYCSAHFYNSYGGQYDNFMHWYIANIRIQLLDTNIVIDVERTLAAIKSPGLSNPVQLWQSY